MHRAIVGTAIALSASAALAQSYDIEVSIESLAPSRGVALTPFHVGFHDGSYDAFNAGGTASAGLQMLAETGDGSGYLGEFMSGYASGVSGVVIADMGGFGPGVFVPGSSGSAVFTLDASDNRFMSFASMAVPSNDRFVGNDDAMGVELFDAGGAFVGTDLVLYGRDIWDAGTEVDGLFGAAFVVGQDAADHIDQNGVIATNYDFSLYSGAMTPAGYDFVDLPTGDGPIARISFRVVPAPSSLAFLGLGGMAVTRRRRG